MGLGEQVGRLNERLGGAGLSTTFEVTRLTGDGPDGVLHQKQRPCFAPHVPGRRTEALVGCPEFEVLEIPLATLLGDLTPLCSCVVNNLDLRYWRSSGFDSAEAALCVLGQVYSGMMAVGMFNKHAKRKACSAAALLTDRDTLRRLSEALTAYPLSLFDDAANDAIAMVAGDLSTAVGRAEDLINSESSHSRTLAKVKVVLVGKEQSASYVFDETPMLVAITGWRKGKLNALVNQLVELFSISKGEHVVLSVPQYVVTYLSSVPKALRNGLVPGVVLGEGDNAVLIEAAVALWEPGGSGDLASLAGALGTARLLVGSAQA